MHLRPAFFYLLDYGTAESEISQNKKNEIEIYWTLKKKFENQTNNKEVMAKSVVISHIS